MTEQATTENRTATLPVFNGWSATLEEMPDGNVHCRMVRNPDSAMQKVTLNKSTGEYVGEVSGDGGKLVVGTIGPAGINHAYLYYLTCRDAAAEDIRVAVALGDADAETDARAWYRGVNMLVVKGKAIEGLTKLGHPVTHVLARLQEAGYTEQEAFDVIAEIRAGRKDATETVPES